MSRYPAATEAGRELDELAGKLWEQSPTGREPMQSRQIEVRALRSLIEEQSRAGAEAELLARVTAALMVAVAALPSYDEDDGDMGAVYDPRAVYRQAVIDLIRALSGQPDPTKERET